MDGSSRSFETIVSVGSSSLFETQLLYISAVRGRDSPAASIQSRSRSCVLPGNVSFAQDDHIVPIPGTRSVDHLNELASGATIDLSESDLQAIEKALPIGWCHGDRYSNAQWKGPERYC